MAPRLCLAAFRDDAGRVRGCDLDRPSQGAAQPAAALAATLVVGFLPLAFIKYADFLANDVLGLHEAIDTAPLRWPLPLGLSFITFTLTAYVIDVYRGKYPLEPSLKILLGYVLFFPHLIAGPILRPHELMPQLRHPAAAQGAPSSSASPSSPRAW